jgi:hypothetical protein
MTPITNDRPLAGYPTFVEALFTIFSLTLVVSLVLFIFKSYTFAVVFGFVSLVMLLVTGIIYGISVGVLYMTDFVRAYRKKPDSDKQIDQQVDETDIEYKPKNIKHSRVVYRDFEDDTY